MVQRFGRPHDQWQQPLVVAAAQEDHHRRMPSVVPRRTKVAAEAHFDGTWLLRRPTGQSMAKTRLDNIC
jgi:hypothetical protein